MLQLLNVTKTYPGIQREIQALSEISLQLEPGRFAAVCGPSGCGKTTLLLTAGTLLGPSSGEVVFEGQDVYALSPEARATFRASRIGFVFQQFHLIPYLSVRDNILAASLASGTNNLSDHADKLIEKFGLADRAMHRPNELSVGERQRTAFARALLNRPKLLLADEPTGNLDGANARAVLDHLSAFAAAGGAVLLVTHDEAAAARADSILTMEKGGVL